MPTGSCSAKPTETGAVFCWFGCLLWFHGRESKVGRMEQAAKFFPHLLRQNLVWVLACVPSRVWTWRVHSALHHCKLGSVLLRRGCASTSQPSPAPGIMPTALNWNAKSHYRVLKFCSMSVDDTGRAGRMIHTLTVKEWRNVLNNSSHVYCGIKPPPGVSRVSKDRTLCSLSCHWLLAHHDSGLWGSPPWTAGDHSCKSKCSHFIVMLVVKSSRTLKCGRCWGSCDIFLHLFCLASNKLVLN